MSNEWDYDTEEEEIDPATCPYCGSLKDHEPSCPMVDYPFDLEVDLDEDDECLD